MLNGDAVDALPFKTDVPVFVIPNVKLDDVPTRTVPKFRLLGKTVFVDAS